MPTTYRIELANRVHYGRATGNLYGVGTYIDGRRTRWALEPQGDEQAAIETAAYLNRQVELATPPASAAPAKTYRTFTRSVTSFGGFAAAPRATCPTVERDLALEEAREACREFNDARTEEEIEAGLAMEFEEFDDMEERLRGEGVARG